VERALAGFERDHYIHRGPGNLKCIGDDLLPLLFGQVRCECGEGAGPGSRVITDRSLDQKTLRPLILQQAPKEILYEKRD
jgi:hypothetical protein